MRNAVDTDQSAVLLIAPAELPEQLPCRVESLGDVGATVTFAAPTALNRGTRAKLVVGPKGNRQLASTLCIERSEAGARPQLLSPWRPYTVRATDRYRADLEVHVRSREYPRSHPGRVVNISATDVTVRVEESFRGRFVELSFSADMFETWPPCTRVEGNADQDGHTLRLSFSDSGRTQTALVRQVIAALAADREASGSPLPTPPKLRTPRGTQRAPH